MKSKSVIIIAEAGVNHNGSMNYAKKLVDISSASGADIIKFQTFKTSELVSKQVLKAKYQKSQKYTNETQYQMLKKLEISKKFHYELIKYCEIKKIEFLSTAFDIESLKFLLKLGIKRIKVPSGEITNYPLLEFIGKVNKKTILSTGISSINEIKEACKILYKSGLNKKNLTILHCTSEYPAPFTEINLNCISSLKKKFNTNVGYSDHALGIEASIAAVAVGANLIEKHITLNKSLEGPDHKSSIEKDELNELVRSIKNISVGMGDGIKKASKSELKNKKIIRKFIVAKSDIEIGQIFTNKNLTTKRTGRGMSAILWPKVIGKKSKRKYYKDDIIKVIC